MIISRKGEACFKILVAVNKREKVNILIDPFYGRPKIEADILLLSEAREGIIETKGAPFLIKGPGEYEIKGIFIQGIESPKNHREALTIYTIEFRQLRICYLGNFGQKTLSSDQLEKIGPVDVLIIPIGKDLSPKEIQKIISQVEPKMVVPIEQKTKKSKIKLKDFLKEMGAKEIEEKEKIVLKKPELKEEGIDIVVLK